MPYPGYLSPQQQLALARQEAQVGLLPAEQANARAQAQTREDARNAAASAQAAYRAQADLQAGGGAQISGIYGNAADRQAAYGAGFSGDVKTALDKSTADANALLAQNGSPQQLQSGGQSARDVLYSLGGYSPASVLNAQGAAFGAAAAQQPGNSYGLGIDSAKAARAKGAAAIKDLLGQRADIEARRAGLINQALSGVQSNQSNAYAQWVQGQYLQNSLRKTGADLTGIDPATGQPTVQVRQAADAAAMKKQAVRQKAVAKRNDATVNALAGAQDWVEKQVKPGTGSQQIATVPIKIGTVKVGKASVPMYAKAGGGTTTNPADAAHKPVYAQVPLPKPQYQQLLSQVTSRLSTQLRRYGYKPAQIRAFASDIVDDYYVLTTNLPALRPQTRTSKNSSGGTTTSVGP